MQINILNVLLVKIKWFSFRLLTLIHLIFLFVARYESECGNFNRRRTNPLPVNNVLNLTNTEHVCH